MSSNNIPPPEDEFQVISRRMAASRAARWGNGRPRLTPSIVQHHINSSPTTEEQQQHDDGDTTASDTDESVETVVPIVPVRRGYHVEIGFALIVASELPVAIDQHFRLRLHGFRFPAIYTLFYQATAPQPGNVESGHEIVMEQRAQGEDVVWTEDYLEFWIKPEEVGTWYFGAEVVDHHLSTDRTWWMCADDPVEVMRTDDVPESGVIG